MNHVNKITRRRFIWILFISILAAFAGFITIFNFNTVVKKVLQQDLAHLNIDPSLFDRFVKETQNSNHWESKYFDWKKKQMVRFGYFADQILPSFPYKYKYRHYRGEIVGDFLLSTDFFMNNMNTRKPVKYIGLYNPYARPCSNPFSNLYYPKA